MGVGLFVGRGVGRRVGLGLGVGLGVGLGLTLGEADGEAGATEGEAPAAGTATRIDVISRLWSIQIRVSGPPLVPATTAIPRMSDHEVLPPASWYWPTIAPVSLSIATTRWLDLS